MLKKTHLKKVAELNSEIERQKGLYTMADSESRLWRQRFELLQLSPEIKADTEAAFARGESHQKRKLKNALMQFLTDLGE